MKKIDRNRNTPNFLEMLRIIFLFLPFVVIFSQVSPADVIYLKNNNEIEGVILEDKPDEIIAQLDIGTVTFNPHQIEKIDKWTEEKNQTLREKWLSEKEKLNEQIKKIESAQFSQTKSIEKSEEIQRKKRKDITDLILETRYERILPKATKYKNLLGKTTIKKLKKHPEQTYYLYLPKKYSPAKKWPLFIGIHGYMANGRQAIDLWKEFANPEGFILVCPSFPDGYQRLKHNTDKRMIDIIKELKSNFRIDENKVFIAGFSGGAQFTHRFVLKYPKYVQAASIIAAGSYDRPTYSRQAKKIKFLVMVGDNDLERLEITKKFAKQLKNKGCNVKFKTFPGVGHWVCDEAKRMTIELFREMLMQNYKSHYE